jgi:long-chain acyl-CoA synthetase
LLVAGNGGEHNRQHCGECASGNDGSSCGFHQFVGTWCCVLRGPNASTSPGDAGDGAATALAAYLRAVLSGKWVAEVGKRGRARQEAASRKLMSMARTSVGEWLDLFLVHGKECAYVQRRGYRTERWSYAQVAGLAFQFSRELEAREIVKGERVLLWGENCAEWVAAFLGCALLGVIAVPMDDAATDDFALRVTREVGARLTVCSHGRSAGGVPSLILEELRTNLAAHPSSPREGVHVVSSDPLEIIFTSGTTAEPKGVVITHGNVLSNTAPLETEIRKYLKYERWVHPVRFLNLLPLSHVFGQFLGMLLPPLMAGTVIFQGSLGPSEVLRTIRRERVSVLVAVPRMLQSLKEKVERDEEDGGQSNAFRARFKNAEGEKFLRRGWIFRRLHRRFGWKFWAFISGGAALDRDTEEFWNRLGFAVIQGYGLTETTSLVSVNHPFKLGKGSIGKVLPGREVKLAEDGEILVRGGGVAAGYWMGTGGGRDAPRTAGGTPALPRSSIDLTPESAKGETTALHVAGEDGWYRTGDLGALDADGNLYFKGRKKDVLVTPAGMNVYPEDLEAALRAQSEIQDCVIVGTARGGNEEPCAVVILREGAADPAAVVQSANQRLAEYQRMHEWFVWPEADFPRTTTGKPRLNVIRETVQTRRVPEGPPVAGSSPLADLIGKISGRAATALRQEASLENDLHLSSLERVELMSALEDRYQVDLSETSFSAAHTVGDLERLLNRKGGERVEYHYPRWTLTWPVRWVRTLTYYALMRPAIMLLGWPKIQGRENLKDVRGPVLVICNHVDDVDVGFVQTALPARLRHRLATAAGGEALEALRTPPADRGFLLRAYDRLQWVSGVALLNLFPLPRAAAFLKSFAYAGECVDRGYSVLVFPEGHHTTDGELRPFRAGVGLLATRLGIPVVPMRIDGLFDVKRAGRRLARPGEIRVRIGKPVNFGAMDEAPSIAAELQRRVEELRVT